MISVSTYRYFRMFVEIAVFALLTVAAMLLLSTASGAQTNPRRPQPAPAVAQPAPPAAQTPEPLYREYRGVAVGIRKEQVRQKLGTPGDVSDRQDFFNLSGAESAQVFYDATGRVMAVSVNYLGEGGALS